MGSEMCIRDSLRAEKNDFHMGSPQSLLCGERRNRIVIDPWRLRKGETYDASDDDTPPEIIH